MSRSGSVLAYSIRYDDAPSSEPLASWLEQNVTETDPAFECLSRMVGGTDVLNVAVIDTGFDAEQEALSPKVWTNLGEISGNGLDDDGDGLVDDVHGWDFTRSAALQKDGENPSHGTHVLGLLTAGTDRLRAMGLRASREFIGSGDSLGERVRTAVDFAAAHGARFINRSGPTPAEAARTGNAHFGSRRSRRVSRKAQG